MVISFSSSPSYNDNNDVYKQSEVDATKREKGYCSEDIVLRIL